MESLFDSVLLNKKQFVYKPIPLEKYIILCEKELITCFISNICLYTHESRRINSGNCKGQYEIIIKADELMHFQLNKDMYEGINDSEKLDEYLDQLKCNFAEIYAHSFVKEDVFHKFLAVQINLKCNKSIIEDITNEYKKNIEAL